MDKVQQSRRTFLKTAAAVAAAAPLAGCGVMDAQAKDVTWNREADVVVLGYGNAGTNTAIEAHDAGASVIVLEKMSIGGGNVAVSAGGFVIPTNRDAYFTYLKSLYELSRSEWDEGILNVFCDESMKLGDWMKKLDPRAEVGVYGHAGYQQLPGVLASRRAGSQRRRPAFQHLRSGGQSPQYSGALQYPCPEACPRRHSDHRC